MPWELAAPRDCAEEFNPSRLKPSFSAFSRRTKSAPELCRGSQAIQAKLPTIGASLSEAKG
jgi:hypothetical protein